MPAGAIHQLTVNSRRRPGVAGMLVDLDHNNDVADLIDSGAIRSGYQHFAGGGYLESREVSPYFEEQYHVHSNAHVAAAIAGGTLGSAAQHFIEYGQYENREVLWLVDLVWSQNLIVSDSR